MRGLRSLRTRLVVWFFFAIVLAFTSSALVVGCSRPEAFTTGTEVMAKNVSQRIAIDSERQRQVARRANQYEQRQRIRAIDACGRSDRRDRRNHTDAGKC